MSDLVEEELHVNTISDKQHEDQMLVTPPTRVSKKNKKNSKYKKKQHKGKHHHMNKSKSTSATSSITNPTGCNGKLSNMALTLINTFKTLLLMRGGKRLYMLLAFIAASYAFKEVDTNNGSSSVVSNKKSTSIGGWFDIGSRFSIGSFSFIQGVRALEDCPEHYSANNIDSYDVGSKVTISIEEKVYECTESPCGWKIIGACVGDMFLSSSASAQPTTQTLGMPVHFPSMMPSALDTGGDDNSGDESNLIESIADSDSTKLSLNRVRIHTNKNRQGLFGDVVDENTQAALYYPDYVLAKCVTESSTIFDSNQLSATIEECCDQW